MGLKIIVNADDFGLSHEKNIAIDSMMRSHICSNTSLFVNMPATEEAIEMAYAGGYQNKISLHINLTEGTALTWKISEIPLYYENDNFAFRPIITQNKQIYPIYIRAIREEIEMQIRRFLSFGIPLNSIDSHNWIHLRLPVWIAIKPLIKKYNISIVRPMWEGYKKPEIASEKWARYFRTFDHMLQKTPQCKVIGWTSNAEQFLISENHVKKCKYAEIFTHPEQVDGEIMDMSSSYRKNPRKKVTEWASELEKYEKVSMKKILEEMGR